ncbi:MAG: hypothetical protein J6A28_03585 [Clostridia bacterium]|nr:hypothetical protein [Clostridia bacterium]
MHEVAGEKKFKECFHKGLKFIYPQNKLAWAEAVGKSFEGKYKGADIEIVLRVMEALDAGKDACDVYTQILKRIEEHEAFVDRVLVLVAQFSKHGFDFYSTVAGSVQARVLTGNEQKFLSRIARMNEKYQKELSQHDLPVL